MLGAVGCRDTQEERQAEVVRVMLQPWPEGPVLEARPGAEEAPGDVDLNRVRRAVPNVLPDPLEQPARCTGGLLVVIRLGDGSRLEYGPCRRPTVIERLRFAILRAARQNVLGPSFNASDVGGEPVG